LVSSAGMCRHFNVLLAIFDVNEPKNRERLGLFTFNLICHFVANIKQLPISLKELSQAVSVFLVLRTIEIFTLILDNIYNN